MANNVEQKLSYRVNLQNNIILGYIQKCLKLHQSGCD